MEFTANEWLVISTIVAVPFGVIVGYLLFKLTTIGDNDGS